VPNLARRHETEFKAR